jgi:hypothetical protein
MAFIKIENRILEKIITSHFTQRQLKILLFLIRFSFGLKKKEAVFEKKDVFYAGVSPYCLEGILRQLLLRGVIKWNPEKGIFWINTKVRDWIEKKSKIDPF